ncbi:serine/threonine protein kinase [Amnibacterium flavum]|uniref:non-specific serine/threonine protein kinase n=2 Tax=Amnibacterium flavum TaxID=2173173 RepID=A0A2V1HV16_9MICO|nr:serine/threonine protein kinase [Amnibacterium flavum]
MARRLPSTPPALPGFSYVRALGSGGFADVFLYEQNMPRRQVAVKVMLSEVVNEQVRQMFQAEANLMAQLSTHPSILTVYQASVSADGRPYLVMELCSAGLSERYRREPVPVAEVLRIAIKIASAVETAHRAGVLHRDIKPSNILTTAYGHPVLSDFGIAATLSESERTESIGLSIPWSAPEVLMDETAGTVASEVWSVAATIYSLLAGRSPFEIPGGENKSVDLISRINRARPQPIGRPDVPPRLESILQRAMSKKPEQRPASVLELIRELQSVETELGVPQTQIEVAMDDWALATVADLEDRTRVRGIPSPKGAPERRRRRGRLAETTGDYRPVGTLQRPQSGSLERSLARSQPGGRTTWLAWTLVAASVLVIALGATAAFVLFRAASGDIPTVDTIQAEVSGRSVDFSWDDVGANGDSYRITTSDGGSSVQKGTTFTVDSNGRQVCITVTVLRDGRPGDVSPEKCAGS